MQLDRVDSTRGGLSRVLSPSFLNPERNGFQVVRLCRERGSARLEEDGEGLT